MTVVIAALCAIDRASGPAPDSRMVRAVRRVIRDGGFQLTLAALAAILAIGALGYSGTSRSAPSTGSPHPGPQPLCESAAAASEKSRCSRPQLARGLLGLLAMAELSFHGYSLIQVTPAGQFKGADPVSQALQRLWSEQPSSQPLRIKARDSFYGDLRAVDNGFEKTNVNDVFQLHHAARLYEALYPVASRPRRLRDQPMNEAVEEFTREVRQAVFDRMSVEYLVSDRIENDPAWPVAAEGVGQGTRFVIQRNPSAMPRAYVVPHAALVPDREAFTPNQFRRSDARCRW